MSNVDERIEELCINGYGVYTPRDKEQIKALIQEEAKLMRIDDLLWVLDRIIQEDTIEDIKESVEERFAKVKAGDE